jgi:predicted metal-dependent hydrolase
MAKSYHKVAGWQSDTVGRILLPMTNEEANWPVEVVRSTRRRKSVSAELKNGVLVVRAPAAMSDAELAPVIEKLQARLVKRVKKAPRSDEDLEKRARKLNKQFFNGRFHWQSVRFVTNQNTRFGSCTPSHGTIRLSHRLAKMPQWVLDYVLVHELAHLEEANHGPRFWKLVNNYPLTERARGYLMAVGLEEVSGVIA